jgi:hypothetical protein
MSTIINTGTTITEPFDIKLQGQTIEIGSTAGPTAALIFNGDSLVSSAEPTLDSASLITEQIAGQNTAVNALLETLGTFINAGTIAAEGPLDSTLTLAVAQSGSGAAGRFINQGVLRVGSGNTASVSSGPNSAFIQSGGTISVLGSGALDIGAPGTDATGGAVNVAAGQSLIATGLIDAATANDGTVASSNAGSIAASMGGTLEITGSVSGSGTLMLGSGTTLKLDSALTGQSIVFETGAPETLVLGSAGTSFSLPIANFQDLDSISLGDAITIDSANLSGNTLTIDATGAQYQLTNFSLAPNTGTIFTVSQDQHTITLSNRTLTWEP